MSTKLILNFTNKNLDFETLNKQIENSDVENFTTLLVDENRLEKQDFLYV